MLWMRGVLTVCNIHFWILIGSTWSPQESATSPIKHSAVLCQPGLTALREVCVCIPDIFVGYEYRQENKIAQPSQLTQFKQMTRNRSSSTEFQLDKLRKPRKAYFWKVLFYICILSNFVLARAAWKFSWTSLNITVIRYLYKGPNFKKQSTWLKIGFVRVLLIFRSGGEHHLVTMVAIPPTNLYNIGQMLGAFFNNLWGALLLL